LLQTSARVAALPDEGQKLPELRAMMRNQPWNPETVFDWEHISQIWHQYWDDSKPVLLEKSPPHLCRLASLQEYFAPARYILLLRDPLAICEALHRRNAMDWQEAAERWLHWLHLHLDCRETLSSDEYRVVYYEDMVIEPQDCFARLGTWMPELADVDPAAAVEAHAIDGVQRRSLLNMNTQKLELVSAEARRIIVSELVQARDLVEQTPYAAIYL
jgi:hypothetical protein